VVYCPLRPARQPCWWARDFTAAELGCIRYLELLPPLVYVGLAHRERLMGCHYLAVRDPGELDVLVHGQVDHLAGRPGRSRQRVLLRTGAGMVLGAVNVNRIAATET
jgi:hypothetical protein